MSNNDSGTFNNTGTVIVCVTVMFCFTLAVIAGLAWAIPDGARSSTITVTILAALAPTIAAITVLVRQDKVKEVAHDTNEKVDKVLNGEMEAKMLSVVQRVLDKRDKEWEADTYRGRPGI